MLLGLTLGLILLQDSDADLLKRIQPVVDRACDLDPSVRAEAAEEAVRICREQEPALNAQARLKKPAAMTVLALAGKFDAAALFKISDKSARRVACDLMTPTKDQIPELLRIVEGKDLTSRIAAARSLGRVEEPALRQTISSALGHGMRWAGSADLLFALITAAWRGNGRPQTFLSVDVDADRAAVAIAALCNVPELLVTESFAPSLSRVLENDRIDRTFRSLLIRCVGRRSPSALCPLLSIRDRKFRAEIVDVLDLALTNPLATPAIYDAWRDAREKKLDDGKVPPQPLTVWMEGWLKRLCGGGVTPDTFPNWARANYRSHVDKQADASVERGVAGIRKAFEKELLEKSGHGGPVGVSALTAYALLKCGVAPDDATLSRALEMVLEREPEGNYSVSLSALALGAALEKGAPRREKLERRLGRITEILVDSQLKTGGWTYGARTSPDQSLSGWVYDLSNTQFALLGLRAAANAGGKIPRATWERALALLDQAQLPDGGWSYHGDGPSYDKMTAAGAYSWIICRMSLDEKQTPEDAAGTVQIRAAVKRLAIGAETRPLSSPPDYYLLYSLERLCMISRIERLGTHDWYAEGASLLVRSQSRSGLWAGSYGPVIDTSLSLLFLRKAFIARPEIATESAQRTATAEQALAVFELRGESLFREGVKDVRLGRDSRTSFILVVAESEAAAKTLAEALGKEIDGIPLRFAVE